MQPNWNKPSPLAPTVLCIDDDPDVMQAIKCCLELYGIHVLRAYDLSEACRLSLDHRPDLVISDLVLPGMGRHGALGRLKAHPGTAQVPIVILSGHSSQAVRQRAILMGAAAYLTKPLGLDELLAALRQWITFPSRPVLCGAGAAGNA